MKFLDIQELYTKYSDLKPDEVEKVQSWASKQPHLPKITDLEVALFLHASHFSVEATKLRLDSYYTCRTKLDYFFAARDIAADDLTLHHDFSAHLLLPIPSKGYCVHLMRILDPNHFNPRMHLRRANFSYETEVLQNGPPEAVIFVVDFESARFNHFAQFNIAELKLFFFYLQYAIPGRVIQFHIVNQVSYMSQIAAILRPLFRSDLGENVFIHDKFEDIHKFIPAEIFPNEYKGGKAGPVRELNDKYYKYLLSHREYFLEEEKTRRVVEKLRPGKSNVPDSIFGAEGNFKKLDFD